MSATGEPFVGDSFPRHQGLATRRHSMYGRHEYRVGNTWQMPNLRVPTKRQRGLQGQLRLCSNCWIFSFSSLSG